MTTKAVILKAIRCKCSDCTCHQVSEVRKCHIMDCSLWPYRMGIDPSPARNSKNLKTPSAQEKKFEENTTLIV